MLIDHRQQQEEAFLLEVREPVRRFLKRVLHDPEMAEDAESETMLTLIQRFRAGIKLRRPVSFALQVAWSKALEVQRRVRRKPGIPPTRSSRPNDPARMAELKDWLDAGLNALLPPDRAILHLRYESDLSYRELSRVLGEPIGTIGRRLHDARHALKASLEGSDGEPVSDATIGVLLPLLPTLDCLSSSSQAASSASSLGLAARKASLTTINKTFLGFGLVVIFAAGTWVALLSGMDARATRSLRSDVSAPTSAPAFVAKLEKETKAPADDLPLRSLPIAGRVVDESGRGVARATVYWMRFAGTSVLWDPTFSSRSDVRHVVAGADGGFEITTAPDETLLHLVASAPGFAPAIRPNVRTGVADVVLQVGAGLTIGGTIMDLHGAPIADATATYHARMGEHRLQATVKSARDGRYRFDHLPIDPAVTRPDSGTVAVDADGYASQLKPVGTAMAAASADGLELDVWLARGSVLEGTVRDEESGTPIAQATVEVWSNPASEAPSLPGLPPPDPDPIEPRRLVQVTTDQFGHYRIDHLPVRIAGVEPGCRYAPLIKMETPVLAGGLVVTASGRATLGALIPLVTEDESVVALDVELRPEIVISGEVRDTRGAPVGGVEVRAAVVGREINEWVTAPDRIQGRSVLCVAVSDADGNWSLGGLPHVDTPAKLEITASSAAHEAKMLLLADVHESARVPDIVLNERATTRCRGVVVDDQGLGIPGALLEFAESASSPTVSDEPFAAATDREGRFELPLPRTRDAGLEVRVEALGFVTATLTAPPPNADERELRVTMSRERVLRGKVRSAEDLPVAGALVTAVPATCSTSELSPEHLERTKALAIATTTSDASGNFVLRGLPQSRVNLWTGVPWLRNDGLLALLLGRRFSVVVPEPSTSDAFVVTLPTFRADRRTLRVRALDAASKAPLMHGLTGSLVGADGKLGGHGMFVGPGRLDFHAVPSGTYRLLVQAADHALVSMADVRIGGPAGRQEIRLEISRGARVIGRVTSDGDRPAGVIYVRAELASKDVVPLTLRCRDDGSFDIDGLAAGEWRISACLHEMGRHTKMISRPVTMVLEVGKTAPPLEILLLPIKPVSVRLNGLFADGDPIRMDADSPQYADALKMLGQFRVRCRDEADVVWLDATIQTMSFAIAGRDLVVSLPLPEGSYSLVIDRGETRIDAREISSPGSAEIRVPDP